MSISPSNTLVWKITRIDALLLGDSIGVYLRLAEISDDPDLGTVITWHGEDSCISVSKSVFDAWVAAADLSAVTLAGADSVSIGKYLCKLLYMFLESEIAAGRIAVKG